MPLTARRKMTLHAKGASILHIHWRYNFAAISLITGRPWSTVSNFVAFATDRQSLEYNPLSG
jgi:hypothetical protein